MSINKITGVFSNEEILKINSLLQHDNIIHEDLGRLQYNPMQLPNEIINKVQNIADNFSKNKLNLSSVVCVEYNNKYGKPNLPVHWDHDNTDLIINYQLESTTSWDIGVDLKVYNLEDNTALVFNPNAYTHWRPHKTFKDNEFIKMIFFRFIDIENPSDYSVLDYIIEHEVFNEIEEFRNSLGT
jgi:hypothetical protein